MPHAARPAGRNRAGRLVGALLRADSGRLVYDEPSWVGRCWRGFEMVAHVGELLTLNRRR